MKYAKFSKRLSAFILDILIMGIPFILFLTIFIAPFIFDAQTLEMMNNTDDLTASDFKEIYTNGVYLQIAIILLWGLVCGLFISSKMQATPGKKIMKLQVTDGNSQKPSFFSAFGRFIALPLLLLTLQTPERYLIHENFNKTGAAKFDITNEEEVANYLQTPLSSATNILSLILCAAWFMNIVRDRQSRAFHDVLFDTRVVDFGK